MIRISVTILFLMVYCIGIGVYAVHEGAKAKSLEMRNQAAFMCGQNPHYGPDRFLVCVHNYYVARGWK